MQLVIGNKNYSSWSLRPWFLMSAFELEFDEVHASLLHQGLTERLSQYSPTARVPVLLDGALSVWDSLAICEYVSEVYLDGRGWPESLAARAHARSLACEMHSGFSALRNELPMNCRAHRRVNLSDAARRDIARIDAIWSETPEPYRSHGPWLFGAFSIADCFFAPVALRFPTYGIELSHKAMSYAEGLRAHPAIKQWVADAIQEQEIIDEDEVGTPW